MKTDETICLNSKVDGKQPSLEHRIYSADGVAPAMTTGFHYWIMYEDIEDSPSNEDGVH